MDEMTCAAVRERDLAEKYAAGVLRHDERDAFEAHLFECDGCAAQVELLHDLRRELQPAHAHASGPQSRRWLLPLVAAAAMVAVGVSLIGLRSSRTAAPAQSAQAPVPARSATPDNGRASREALLALATIEPPAYVALNLRGAPESDFDRGMAAYSRADYAAASAALARAVRRDPTSPAANFYLGIAHLMIGDAESATDPLRTAAASDSPYRPAALVFLAKALIAVGDLDGATREADRAASLGGDYAAEARRLSTVLHSASESR